MEIMTITGVASFDAFSSLFIYLTVGVMVTFAAVSFFRS